jgi:hypothetical protein
MRYYLSDEQRLENDPPVEVNCYEEDNEVTIQVLCNGECADILKLRKNGTIELFPVAFNDYGFKLDKNRYIKIVKGE